MNGKRLIINTMHRRSTLLLGFFMALMPMMGQTRQITDQKWSDYFSYRNCFDVTETSQMMVGATSLGLILYYKDTRSLSVLNKTNGLSDTGISAIGFYPTLQTLAIGYENGNIDLLVQDKIYNIPDLKIDVMAGSKRINHFGVVGDQLFCSTDFGLLILDPEKREISATYYIGRDASSISVSETAVNEQYIFAATAEGLLRASRQNAQLAFYQSWEQISSQPLFYSDVEVTVAGVLAVRGKKGERVTLERLNGDELLPVTEFNAFETMDATPDGVVVTARGELYFYNEALQTSSTVSSIIFEEGNYQPYYKKSLIAADGSLWFADQNGGLFFREAGNSWQQVLPPGPYTNEVFNVNKSGNDLWIVPGGFSAALNNAGIPAYISVLSAGSWRYFNRSNTPEFKYAVDLINIAVHPVESGKVMVASWGSGIFEFNKLALQTHYMNDNSGLQNIDWAGPRYTRVRGLCYDDQNNLWITNTEVPSGVVVLTSDGIWHRYNYETLSTSNVLGDIVAGAEGYKWLIVHRGDAKGLFVFDDNKTLDRQNDDRYRGVISPSGESDRRNAGQLLLWNENGEELTRDIFCLAFDKSGYLWLGTGNGVVVQYNTSLIFRDEKPVFSRIKVPRNDGSGLADYLLENERITAIAVDGANRKYVGTQNSGVYLISEDGIKTVASYNTTNSPLPSNLINHIHIDDASGEVFIATDMGLVSIKGDAVKGGSSFSNVYAYPNPVRSSYQGPVTITGLMDRTNVKITDTAGNLVYETTSLGGNALWNGKNMWGEKVKSGIYIVLLSSPDGSDTAFTKIAIVR